ncbi:Outer membrane protein TolC [Rhodoferax sp. OV413]|uniref:TolC family protein n=1 Tax=Rhodoferax sp. OV413 TaxID=1855285 RepID=UPI000887CA45|nr:TolC family protein [Rhodoferax sp. OV413]SDN93317.1 Outer membrane protein TolC [Rhodoferax sp. OV413]
MSTISIQRSAAALLMLALTGCATLSPDGDLGAVQQLAQPRIGTASLRPDPQAVAGLLAQPLDAEAAVRIALLNNPQMQESLATLGLSDAERVQMDRLPNPHFAIGRFTEGSTREIERVLSFNVLGLLALPWRAEWQGQQHELAKLQAAQDVVRLAADTRKAWISAVAAQQSALYLRDVKDAAEAGAELARRMARVGNWSRLEQAREQVFLADATAQLARAQQTTFSAREKLTRLMGLWGAQTGFTLAHRLPDIPKTVTNMQDIEARALRERLDVRSAVAAAGYVARQQGFSDVAGYFDGLTMGYTRNTTFDNAAGSKETKRGWELELPLPVFDWGSARHARSKALVLQSTARVRGVAVQARSEAREAYFGYRTAYDLAVHYRDEIVPLRKFINDELVLRYSGMLASVWELLADTRQQVLSVNSAIEAQRDFWLAETDLQTVLSGTSPGAPASLASGAAAEASATQGH